MAIFKADTLLERLEAKVNTYIWLTDILGLPQNNSKDCQKIVIIVFGIEIDISLFIAYILQDKLKKVIGDMLKVLSQKAVSFINIKSCVRYFSFCSQAVRLGLVFMKRLWDFISHYPRYAPRLILR